jgi:peptide-methionine (S)-S-oxide reductase
MHLIFMYTATFGCGCFWGVERAFQRKFKATTMVGYSGGHTQTTDYKKVCTGQTGHAEVIQIQTNVPYAELVEFFYRMHDPTTLNRQGPDVGSQYRSVIFYHSQEQKEIAERITALAIKHYGSVATVIEEFKSFIKAEDYHQAYLDKNPHGYECPSHFERDFKL